MTRQERKARLAMSVEAFRAISDNDVEVKFDAAQRVSFHAQDQVLSRELSQHVESARAYVTENQVRHDALRLERTWATLPDRLIAKVNTLCEMLRADVAKLVEALDADDAYPGATADALQRMDFAAAADINVYRSVIQLVKGINEHRAELPASEKFKLMWEEVNQTATRLGRNQRHCSTSLINNHSEECERVAWFKFLDSARRPEFFL